MGRIIYFKNDTDLMIFWDSLTILKCDRLRSIGDDWACLFKDPCQELCVNTYCHNLGLPFENSDRLILLDVDEIKGVKLEDSLKELEAINKNKDEMSKNLLFGE